ncbi:MAG: MoaD/ThiS family protein [Deltaproteobacteria bacterium]|nr:MoaD/ThiS family protein [Deltaproteobacteria bacterium]
MVIFNFKLVEKGTVQFPLAGPESLAAALEQCAAGEGITLGGYIAVRQGRVVTADELVDDGDEIEIFPAISGG